MSKDAQSLAETITKLLGLAEPPIAIAFSAEPPDGVPRSDADAPAPAADGRTGRAPAGCVFWVRATRDAFTTLPEDHANCSVGSLTHGLTTVSEAASGGDAQSLVSAGWVAEKDLASLPVVRDAPGAITYAPLATTPVEPDVVLLRLNAVQAMMVSDAVPDASFEGKPQCHIVPMAKEDDRVAISVGCMLSRVRTGMKATEMTCAIPGSRLQEVARALTAAKGADDAVARYAAQDAQRFAP